MTWIEVLPSLRRLEDHQKWLKLEEMDKPPHPAERTKVHVWRDELWIEEFLSERGDREVTVRGFAVSKETVTKIRVVPPDSRQMEFPFACSHGKVIHLFPRSP